MRNLLYNFQKKKHWNFQQGDFTENTEPQSNPARGWYRIYTFLAEEQPDFDSVMWGENPEETLALIIINIGAYRECGMEQGALDNIRTILAFFSEKQYDMVLRITYDHEGKALEREPFFFAKVQEHLRQIAPIIREFAENIFVFQGMLVGNWGEMHTSRFVDADKLRILWKILQEDAAEEVFYAVRKPAQWRMLHSQNCGKKQSVYDKMGLFDDAIFGSESHLGTFGSVPRENCGWESLWAKTDELQFEDELCRHVPNGGEAVCGDYYAGGEDAVSTVATLRKMHITYLNRYYDERMMDLWKTWKWTEAGVWQGRSLYEYVGAHLGYRFLVKDVELALTSKRERSFAVSVTIENVGFANLYEEAELYLEWSYGNGERYLKKSDLDMRDIGGGEAQTISFKVPASECELYLFARRKRDGRKIYFANQTVRGSKVFLGNITDVQLN